MKYLRIIGIIGAVLGYGFNTAHFLFISYCIWFCSNTIWAVYSYKKKEYVMCFMFIVYALFTIYGIYNNFPK